jgi:acetate---CoA ligase (ADP-forming)
MTGQAARAVPADRTAQVRALLNPRNIVILGATDKPGNWPQRVWRNLNRYGFKGPVFPMNPGRHTVWETRCYRSFDELPEPPDHVIILIPARFVADAVRDASRAGARSATVMTSGFGEVTDEGSAELTAELQRALDETGLAISGPNCLGNFNAANSMVTMPDDRAHRLEPGPVAIVGQSGGLLMAVKRTLEERGLFTGALVTSGNEMNLTTADYIRYFAEDSATKVIVSYLEAVHDPENFLSACRAAKIAGKPVLVVKLGASDAGRAAAMAHTGALAGSMQAFDAVAGEAGAIRLRNLDDLVEAVEFFVHARAPRGPKLGAITFSGGMRGLMLDLASSHGLEFAELGADTRAKLADGLAVGTIVGNPLDAGFTAVTGGDAYLRSVKAMLDDPAIDILLLQEELPRAPASKIKDSYLRGVNALAAASDKPVVYVTMISHGLTDYSRELRGELANVAFLQEMDKSLRTLRAITANLMIPRTAPAPRRSPSPATRELLDELLKPGAAQTLNEVDSKRLLAAYGITSVREQIATDAEHAAQIAEGIGFPVVAKAVSAALPHKSDAGGVILGLNSADAVRNAFRDIEQAMARHPAKPKLDGVLIAEQATGGLELVLGTTRDPEMGLVILFGSGGVDLELRKDIALAAPPLDASRALALIERTQAGILVKGYRGRPALDCDALVAALVGLSNLILDTGERIASIDVNPFLLREKGGVALDALVVLNDQGATK